MRTHKVEDKLRNSPLLSVLSKYAENVIIHSDKVTEVLLFDMLFIPTSERSHWEVMG